MNSRRFSALILTVLLGIPVVSILLAGVGSGDRSRQILHVSYDPTRELYQRLNPLFTEHYRRRHGVEVTVLQSHGGSGSQARSVLDGLEADVVSLALFTDIDVLRDRGLIEPGWPDRLPNRSLPYHSTVVFVVRAGNPLGIQDWDDLIVPDVRLVMANPKVSGGARLIFLAAWGHALRKFGTEEAASDFVRRLYANAEGLETGSRAATVKFARAGIGDVHLTWENEALLERQELGDAVEIVYPASGSIKAEPFVAYVDANVARHGTSGLAEEYLKYLFSEEAQRVIAEEHFRPSDERFAREFADIELFSVGDVVPGGWPEAQGRFFAPGAFFDRMIAGSD